MALGNSGDSITAGQFRGEDTPPAFYFDGLVNAICRKWVDDGQPKTIIRVPPMRGGSQGLVGRLIHALTAGGARVLNATGTEAKDQERFLAALRTERNESFPRSQYDIIVGIQRVLEGTDWPLCSAVYSIGMPGSLNTVVQLLGRAMRLKDERYPATHRDQARLVFFVPCGGGSALAALSIDHSRHALLTCCFLADHEVGQEWIVLREIRRGVEDALGPRDQNPAAADADNEANEALDPELRAEIEFAMATACEQIMSDGGEPTVSEVVQLAAKTRPDLPEADLHRVAVEILASQPGSSGAKAREAIYTEVEQRLRIEPMVKRAMEHAFAVILTGFRDATLKDSVLLETVRRQVHSVTGGQMREFATRLNEAAASHSPKGFNVRRTEEFCERYESLNNLPKQNSKDPQERDDAAWLGQKRMAKRGRSKQAFFPEMEETAARYGMAGLFDVRDRMARALQRTKELCQFLTAGAEVPKQLATWCSNVKQLKQRRLRGENVEGYYPPMEEIVAEHGLAGVFDVETDDDRRRQALRRVEALCQRISHSGHWPRTNSSDAQERVDALLVTRIRMAKLGRGKHQYLPEYEQIVARYALEGLFDDLETRMLKQTRAFCGKYRGGQLPTAMPNDPNRKDGQWLAAKRRVKAGEASGRWYPAMDQIASEEGLKGLFDGEVITRELALDCLRRFYSKHGEYPDTQQGRVEEADDGYGYRGVSWAAVHRRFPLQELIDSSRPPFSADLVVKWNAEELSAGRAPISKTGTAVVEAAKADGYPISGSMINVLLRRKFSKSVAELLRPSNRTEFSVGIVERWLREEYAATRNWPTVTSECIRSAAADGYVGLTGNALNKLLRKVGTSLRQVKARLQPKVHVASKP